MIIYFALSTDGFIPILLSSYLRQSTEINLLASYAYPEYIKSFYKIWNLLNDASFEFWKSEKGRFYNQGLEFFRSIYNDEKHCYEELRKSKIRFLLDSGAFTAYTRGKVIRLEEYADFCFEMMEKFRGLNELRFVNLDVINNQDLSDRNFEKLRSLGIPVLPVLTYGADISRIKELVKQEDYILIGGAVGKTKKQLNDWLDRVFKILLDIRLIKVHLLGITREWVLTKYPAYSCDSSGWNMAIRKGSKIFKNIGTIQINGDLAAKILNLDIHREILRLIKLEKSITKLWEERGIQWN